MKIDLLNFYFTKGGYKKNKFRNHSLTYEYLKGKYFVSISPHNKKAFIFRDKELILETGLPEREASVVKWVNILINKDEKANIQISED